MSPCVANNTNEKMPDFQGNIFYKTHGTTALGCRAASDSKICQTFYRQTLVKMLA